MPYSSRPSAGRPCCRKPRCAIRVTKGFIYQTHAIATQDFIKIGGAKVEGTVLAAGGMLVFDEDERRQSDQECHRPLHPRL